MAHPGGYPLSFYLGRTPCVKPDPHPSHSARVLQQHVVDEDVEPQGPQRGGVSLQHISLRVSFCAVSTCSSMCIDVERGKAPLSALFLRSFLATKDHGQLQSGVAYVLLSTKHVIFPCPTFWSQPVWVYVGVAPHPRSSMCRVFPAN